MKNKTFFTIICVVFGSILIIGMFLRNSAINSYGPKNKSIQYECGPISVSIPERHTVETHDYGISNKLEIKDEKNDSHFTIDVYNATVGLATAMKRYKPIYDPSFIFGSYSTVSMYRGSKKHNAVVFSKYSDSAHLLRGELYCFEENGYTVFLHSIGRYQDYRSIGRWLDSITVNGSITAPTHTENVAYLNDIISRFNKDTIPYPAGGTYHFPGMYNGLILDVNLTADHDNKILKQSYIVAGSEKDIKAKNIEWNKVFDAIWLADSADKDNIFTSSRTRAPYIFWRVRLEGYDIEDVFISRDKKNVASRP